MEDTLKKLLYAGVGLAAEATEKLEKSLNDLVEKGKINDTEAKKKLDEFLSKTEDKRKEFEKKFNEFVEKHGYSKSADVVELRKRVEDLESKLGVKKAKATA